MIQGVLGGLEGTEDGWTRGVVAHSVLRVNDFRASRGVPFVDRRLVRIVRLLHPSAPADERGALLNRQATAFQSGAEKVSSCYDRKSK